MCGIVGVLRADGAPVSETLLERMRECLTHRGPDDAGLYLKGGVGLAVRRLAILDLTSAGHQPMSNHDGSLWIVFNGEIYNYLELAADLKRDGRRIVSSSDTEVLLHLYEQFGEECLHRLNGMFAFAVWDARKRVLFAARDRLGIKPFYFHHRPDRFMFASEVKALLEADSSLRRADDEALADYLFAGFPLGARTGFTDVHQLEPGYWLKWRDGRLETARYWNLAYRYEDPSREADLLAELTSLIDDAARIQTRSDVRVGAHLSGGLDSSTVASHAARYIRPLETFSIGFVDAPYYDETEHARTVATHIGAIHHDEFCTVHDFARSLPTMIYHMDFGLPTEGCFGYLAVSRLAKRHVKVSLTGHGGDEVFAGYPKHFGVTFGSTSMFSLSDRPRDEPSFAEHARAIFRREGFAGIVSRLGSRLRPRARSIEDRWVSSHCAEEPLHHPLLHSRFVQRLGGYSPRQQYVRAFHEAMTDEILDKCLYHDLRVYLPQLLAMEDRMSMAVSLESRVPLLDHRVVELMGRIHPVLKVKGRQPKRLLKEVAGPLLPKTIVERRDKRPFPVPVRPWFGGELAGAVRDIVLSPRCLDRGIFEPDRLREAVIAPRLVWPLVNIELWCRIFVDRDPYWVEQATTLTAPLRFQSRGGQTGS